MTYDVAWTSKKPFYTEKCADSVILKWWEFTTVTSWHQWSSGVMIHIPWDQKFSFFYLTESACIWGYRCTETQTASHSQPDPSVIHLWVSHTITELLKSTRGRTCQGLYSDEEISPTCTFYWKGSRSLTCVSESHLFFLQCICIQRWTEWSKPEPAAEPDLFFYVVHCFKKRGP